MTETMGKMGWISLGFAIGLLCSIMTPLIIPVIITLPYPVLTTSDNLDNLKADCYVSGFVDGRGSILEEQSQTDLDVLGLPEGYTSDRTDEWRSYASGITSSQSKKQTTSWFYPGMISPITAAPTPAPITTIPDDAVITGISWYEIRKGVELQDWQECYENETGQDSNDLVMHGTCPKGAYP